MNLFCALYFVYFFASFCITVEADVFRCSFTRYLGKHLFCELCETFRPNVLKITDGRLLLLLRISLL